MPTLAQARLVLERRGEEAALELLSLGEVKAAREVVRWWLRPENCSSGPLLDLLLVHPRTEIRGCLIRQRSVRVVTGYVAAQYEGLEEGRVFASYRSRAPLFAPRSGEAAVLAPAQRALWPDVIIPFFFSADPAFSLRYEALLSSQRFGGEYRTGLCAKPEVQHFYLAYPWTSWKRREAALYVIRWANSLSEALQFAFVEHLLDYRGRESCGLGLWRKAASTYLHRCDVPPALRRTLLDSDLELERFASAEGT